MKVGDLVRHRWDGHPIACTGLVENITALQGFPGYAIVNVIWDGWFTRSHRMKDLEILDESR
jgi:hypothetical protein